MSASKRKSFISKDKKTQMKDNQKGPGDADVSGKEEKVDYTLYTRFYQGKYSQKENFKHGIKKTTDIIPFENGILRPKAKEGLSRTYDAMADWGSNGLDHGWDNSVKPLKKWHIGGETDPWKSLRGSPDKESKKDVSPSVVPEHLKKFIAEVRKDKPLADDRFPKYHEEFYLIPKSHGTVPFRKGKNPYRSVDYRKQMVWTNSKNRSHRLTEGKSAYPWRKGSFLDAHDIKEALRLQAEEKARLRDIEQRRRLAAYGVLDGMTVEEMLAAGMTQKEIDLKIMRDRMRARN
jgi:hypothetical protein